MAKYTSVNSKGKKEQGKAFAFLSKAKFIRVALMIMKKMGLEQRSIPMVISTLANF